MTTYWHVANPSYRVGEDLLCWDELIRRSDLGDGDWKWPDVEVGFDGHVVCLFTDDERGRQERDWMLAEDPARKLLRVEIGEADDDIRMTRVVEGYHAAYGRIPERCITMVNR